MTAMADRSANTRKSMLVVFPVAPWPPRDNGVAIRYYPMLQKLARDWDIDLLVLGDFRERIPSDPLTAKLRRVEIQRLSAERVTWPDRFRTNLEAFSPVGLPVKFARYHTPKAYVLLRSMLRATRYDVLLWVGYDHLRALKALRAELKDTRVIRDLVDSPYLHYSRMPRPSGIARVLHEIDLWKTRRWEQSLVASVDEAIYISPADAAAVNEGTSRNLHVIPNGILVSDFPPQSPQHTSAPVLGFLGNMGYAPNIDGALRLYREIFKPLKESIPDLRLMIIGRGPVPEIQALACDDVIVTGTVDNIWEYIAQVSVFVFPMSTGAGLQNKILEVLYAGKPVVTTEICRVGVGATNGVHLATGSTIDELLELTRSLVMDQNAARRLAEEGQRYVRRVFDSDAVLRAFDAVLRSSTAA